MPASGLAYDRKFHASAECWSVYEEVLATEYQNAVLFGQVHQLTVDAYSVQHAGGEHPDKSVCIHLLGLYLVLERGVPPMQVAPLLQRRAAAGGWPHLEPPEERAALTVFDVGMAGSPQEHARIVQEWAREVWRVWRPHHAAAAELATGLLPG